MPAGSSAPRKALTAFGGMYWTTIWTPGEPPARTYAHALLRDAKATYAGANPRVEPDAFASATPATPDEYADQHRSPSLVRKDKPPLTPVTPRGSRRKPDASPHGPGSRTPRAGTTSAATTPPEGSGRSHP